MAGLGILAFETERGCKKQPLYQGLILSLVSTK